MVDVKVQTPSDLARLVKNARLQGNLTQQAVADAVGVTRQSIARLERGNAGSSFDTVLLILDFLGIHLDATTDHRTTAPATLAAGGAAQAAADALAKRLSFRIDLEASDGHDPKLPGSVLVGLPRTVEAELDAAPEDERTIG